MRALPVTGRTATYHMADFNLYCSSEIERHSWRSASRAGPHRQVKVIFDGDRLWGGACSGTYHGASRRFRFESLSICHNTHRLTGAGV